MPDPISGPTSSDSSSGAKGSSKPDEKKFKEAFKKVEKVEKVSETELDKQRKRRLFPQMQDDRDEEKGRMGEKPPAPPPFRSLSPLPNPSKDPPPPFSKTTSNQEVNLPHSQKFWNEHPLPGTPSFPEFQEMNPQLLSNASTEEKEFSLFTPSSKRSPSTTSSKKPSPATLQQKNKQLLAKEQQEEEAALSTTPIKKTLQQEATKPSPATLQQKNRQLLAKEQQEEESTKPSPATLQQKNRQLPAKDQRKEEEISSSTPSSRFTQSTTPMKKPLQQDLRKPSPATLQQKSKQLLAKDQKKEEERAASLRKSSKKSHDESEEPPFIPGQLESQKIAPSKEDAVVKEARRKTLLRTEEERKQHKRPFDQITEVLPPNQFPADIQSTIASVQVNATTHLDPQVEKLFLQLVGTILFITPSTPGISRTEVLLNSPALANSVFFNSTIVLEKYATAPDSFNIQFTGSAAAIQLAQESQNALLTSFAAAYHDKKISFRIGRFETFLPTERHLIRRKQELGEKGDKGEEPLK